MTRRIYEPNLRLTSTFDGPLLGNAMYQYGFYDAGILREVLNHLGSGNFKVWALPIPRDEEEFQVVKTLVHDPLVQYALVDKNKVVFVTLKDNPGWMTVLNELGYEVFSGPKTNKRLKSAHRVTLLNANFEHLNIRIVEPDEFTRYNFKSDDMEQEMTVSEEYRHPEVIERLLDGGFVVSKRLLQQAVQNIPMFHPSTPEDSKQYYYDPYVRKQLVHDLLDSPIFNTRIICPLGFIKGNAIFVDLPEGVDVITSRANIKKEFRYTKGYRFLAEPQGSKSRVLTDDQTIINFPMLFPDADIDLWLTEEYQKIFDEATNNKILTNWKYVYQRKWREDQDPDDNEARARTAYTAYRWVANGMKLTDSPWLFETTTISRAKPLESRIPIPCSVYEQVIPESLARMAGFNVEVQEDTIIRINELGVHVVNDMDWLEMYPSHGGHDQDDFFKIFYREIEGGIYDGMKMVIVIRSPNGYGEYSMFEYVEGSWNPAWHYADRTEVRFPKIDGTNLPQRLSHAIKFGSVSYSGLPSENKPKQTRSGPYTQDDVLRDVRIAMAGGKVGLYVNAAMLHSSTIAQHRPIQVCSLETVIDKCINPDDIEDVIAIDTESERMIREVIDSKLPIDPYVWRTRGSTSLLMQNDYLDMVPGKMSYFMTACDLHHHTFINKVRRWSQENARPPEMVYKLGNRFSLACYPVLRHFRSDQYIANVGTENNIDRTTWESLYHNIEQKILQFDREEDRHDFILGLYICAMQNPTSGGRITDQIVINRIVYPYLEAALQHYGVALIPYYSMTNGQLKIQKYKNSEFYWPDENGTLIRYTDPLDYQNAHKLSSDYSYI